MKQAPKTPFEVYQNLPEMKIELIYGKIIWGGREIKANNDFEKDIKKVIDKYMEQADEHIIMFAAYLSECVNRYKESVD